MEAGTHPLGPIDDRLTERVREEIAGRRFARLAAAIEAHEVRSARLGLGTSPHSGRLYGRLRALRG
jgi:hypothetical protein